jgi:hypothetical protein
MSKIDNKPAAAASGKGQAKDTKPPAQQKSQQQQVIIGGKFKRNADGLPVLNLVNGSAYTEWVEEIYKDLHARCGAVAYVLKSRTRSEPDPLDLYGVRDLTTADARRLSVDRQLAAKYNIWKKNQALFERATTASEDTYVALAAVNADTPEEATARVAHNRQAYQLICADNYFLDNLHASVKEHDRQEHACDKRERIALRAAEHTCYGLLYKCLSNESIQTIQNTFAIADDFNEMNRLADLELLVNKLYSTHLRSYAGVDEIDLLSITMNYYSLKQRSGETIAQFNERTTNALRNLEDANHVIR